MLDCGIHPGLSGMDALPFVDMIEADQVIKHFYLFSKVFYVHNYCSKTGNIIKEICKTQVYKNILSSIVDARWFLSFG